MLFVLGVVDNNASLVVSATSVTRVKVRPCLAHGTLMVWRTSDEALARSEPCLVIYPSP